MKFVCLNLWLREVYTYGVSDTNDGNTNANDDGDVRQIKHDCINSLGINHISQKNHIKLILTYHVMAMISVSLNDFVYFKYALPH